MTQVRPSGRFILSMPAAPRTSEIPTHPAAPHLAVGKASGLSVGAVMFRRAHPFPSFDGASLALSSLIDFLRVSAALSIPAKSPFDVVLYAKRADRRNRHSDRARARTKSCLPYDPACAQQGADAAHQRRVAVEAADRRPILLILFGPQRTCIQTRVHRSVRCRPTQPTVGTSWSVKVGAVRTFSAWWRPQEDA